MKMLPPRLRLASLIVPLEIVRSLMATVTLPFIVKMRNSGVAVTVERCTVSVDAPLPLMVISDVRSGRTLVRLMVQTPPMQPGSPPAMLKLIVFASGKRFAALMASRSEQCAVRHAPLSKSSVVLTVNDALAVGLSSLVMVSVVALGGVMVARSVGL